ncbi:hypothetical protein [Nocardia arthritidis]|uniref:Uncharacterized protein n=1 Tax=Nocardia arthritidis TaxID=228602 RepID=A0A6G9Y8G8_9NOCA|nr:hypothetical protein [Nocardia arthritidis]QIS09377.1 hypothetical protein F5544_07355 [Nocardia arthritidis]
MTEGYRGARTASEWEVLGELTARATAFASETVRTLWQESAVASLRLSEYVEECWPQWGTDDYYERLEVEETMQADPDFARLNRAKDDAEQKLAKQIRIELHVDAKDLTDLPDRVLKQRPSSEGSPT